MSAPRRASSLKRVARLLARPALSPIDGRVADINRRVEHVRASTEASLDAYAQSAAESSSYIGVELRRLHDLLEGFGERAFQENYEMRLAHALGLPLEKLDESLANVINYATGRRGFYAQAGLWFSPLVEVALSAGTAAPVRVDKRIIELPFAMAALSRLDRGARILDAGGPDSTFALAAASLGYKVTAVDSRPLGYAHPNLESHPSLLEDSEALSDPFDGAFLVSTFEHIGSGARGGAYAGPEHAIGSDDALLDRVGRLLSQNGIMILTAPYGTPEGTDAERTYDEDSLNRLLAEWDVMERELAVRRDPLVWEVGKQVEPGVQAVAMLIAAPKRQQ